KQRCVFHTDKFWKHIRRMLKCVRCQRQERFHLTRKLHPPAQRPAPTPLPRLRGKRYVQRVQKWQLRQLGEQILPCVHPIHDSRQPPHRPRPTCSAHLCHNLPQPFTLKLFPLKSLQDPCEQLQSFCIAIDPGDRLFRFLPQPSEKRAFHRQHG